MKPGDRVIWLHSPGRSFLSGWRVAATSGVIVRIHPKRIRIVVKTGKREKQVNVDPENVSPEAEMQD
jgi:ribosomal protein L21E